MDSEASDNVFVRNLPEQIRNQDPRAHFPDFEHGAILRFTRIFGGNFRRSDCVADVKDNLWSTSRTYRTRMERQRESMDRNNQPALICNGQKTQKLLDFCTDEQDLLRAKDLDSILPNESADMVPRRKFRRAYRYRKVFRLGNIWNDAEEGELVERPAELPENTFLPMNYVRWEDNIIMDSKKARKEMIKELSRYRHDRLPRCGWIPTEKTPTLKQFLSAWEDGSFLKYLKRPSAFSFSSTSDSNRPSRTKRNAKAKNSNLPSVLPDFSIFPEDKIGNAELEECNWEDQIIWGN